MHVGAGPVTTGAAPAAAEQGDPPVTGDITAILVLARAPGCLIVMRGQAAP